MMLVNNPGTWSAVYAPLRHADWHGWTFTDTVFPFFLWITGVAMTLSFARRVEAGADRRRLLLHTVRRAALIFLVGLFLNGFPYFPLDRIRIPGVLQRIAVCYLIAGAIYLFTRVRGQVFFTGFFLVVYALLMNYAPFPGRTADAWSQEANFARYIDGRFLAGHMWSQTKVWDPEGIVSTLPAIATCLFGVLTGHLLRRAQWAPAERAVWMFVQGAGLLWLGAVWSWWMPVNKNLWTSSYALLMAGLASTVFAASYWLVDQRGGARHTRPLAIYGMNAIAVYVLSGITARLLGLIRIGDVPAQRWIFENFFAPLGSPVNASLLFGLAFVLYLYAVAWGMYRRRWFLKL
jgi:predicted acyltransferase